ncbi:OLC1v1039173C3 [Oldenlandia corymbosa var. corymbosa]|uniref:OLC1v1039173C3 n=1 Tax=Oldenlandia corymbosa var. corymbosa TaxID=529605 RepID=A0AAV1D1I6_OLDCO|nr:OLC1v1039173C3 [Oldenlandia corymbosa var. corymbosa]
MEKRYAVVTGSNKGIGFEIVRQLASHGITVVLTSRDEKRGLDAVQKLKESDGFSDDILLFHQLDVANSSSVASLAEFIKNQFRRLDILVNNAGIIGAIVDVEVFKCGVETMHVGTQNDWRPIRTETYELATECLETNYYGAKRMIEAFLPLLQSSQSPRIVNVTSTMGRLRSFSNEWAKAMLGKLSDVENLTEEKVDEVLSEYLKDFKSGSQLAKGWPFAYSVSKAALNAYTRILAKKFPSCKVNSICPGYVKTDINHDCGMLSAEEGAEWPVKLALMSDDGPSGLMEDKIALGRKINISKTPSMAEATKVTTSKRLYAVVTGANKGIGFEVVRQLASQGITVVLTARDAKRGLDALQKLKGSGGFPDDLLLFHQLDVIDMSSIASLSDFIRNVFGRLDILVNNAGITGAHIDGDAVKSSFAAAGGTEGAQISWDVVKNAMSETYDSTLECLQINYYGAKRVIEAFLPLLQLSQSPRIVNVSSEMGKLKNIPSERAKGLLRDVDSLTEERMDEMLNAFLKDYKEGSLEANGWPLFLSGYTVSKASMNAYTRILAKRHHNFKVNCVCPGFAKTDSNLNSGIYSVEECAERVVRLALQPDDGPSGLFFVHGKLTPFD